MSKKGVCGSIGIAVCLLIFLFIMNEYNFMSLSTDRTIERSRETGVQSVRAALANPVESLRSE